MSKVPITAIGAETELLRCPYEVSHMIMRKRFQVHLIRCRRSHPKTEVVTCPFNVSHRVNKLELEWHISYCFDRKSFENFCHRPAQVVGLTSSIDRTFCDTEAANRTFIYNRQNDITISGGEFVEPSETWDDEPDVATYNPTNYTRQSEILRMPVGMTPSQRNEFRVSERKRLQALAKQ